MAAITGGRLIPRKTKRALPVQNVSEQVSSNFTSGGDILFYNLDPVYAQADHNAVQSGGLNGKTTTFGYVLDCFAWQDDATGDANLQVLVARSGVPLITSNLYNIHLLGPGLVKLQGIRCPGGQLGIQWASNAFSVGNAALSVHFRNQ